MILCVPSCPLSTVVPAALRAVGGGAPTSAGGLWAATAAASLRGICTGSPLLQASKGSFLCDGEGWSLDVHDRTTRVFPVPGCQPHSGGHRGGRLRPGGDLLCRREDWPLSPPAAAAWLSLKRAHVGTDEGPSVPEGTRSPAALLPLLPWQLLLGRSDGKGCSALAGCLTRARRQRTCGRAQISRPTTAAHRPPAGPLRAHRYLTDAPVQAHTRAPNGPNPEPRVAPLPSDIDKCRPRAPPSPPHPTRTRPAQASSPPSDSGPETGVPPPAEVDKFRAERHFRRLYDGRVQLAAQEGGGWFDIKCDGRVEGG